MARPVVVVTRRLPERVEAELRRDFDVRLNGDDRPLDADALAAALREADAVVPTVTDRLDATLLAASPRRARILANVGVGYNHIDVAAARRAGLVVTNTPGVLTEATADLAMLLVLMAARRAGEGERLVRAARWTGWAPTQLLGHMVSGRTIGIVGLGRIGRATARRARFGFGMRVLAHTRTPDPAALAEVEAEPCTLDELLARADFVSLHCPATAETRHLIGERELGLMRRTAYLINTARGDVVDERALAGALRAGRIAGAGLDVYEEEPQVAPELLELEQVVLLPHLGSATLETREAMGLRAVENLRAWFAGEPPPDRVA
jgi:lactate dehydrogenase-like 2-hydroxyacid dehydrogenase